MNVLRHCLNAGEHVPDPLRLDDELTRVPHHAPRAGVVPGLEAVEGALDVLFGGTVSDSWMPA